MEHSLSIEPAAPPWRTVAVVATAVAAVEFLVLFGVFGIKPLVGHLKDAAAAQATGPASVPEPPPIGQPSHPRSTTSVLVLNGNGRTGAAAAEAERARSRGYKIGGIADAKRTDYSRSIVMYRSGFRPEAARLARDLDIGVVGPLDGMKPRELLGAHLAVVVGAT